MAKKAKKKAAKKVAKRKTRPKAARAEVKARRKSTKKLVKQSAKRRAGMTAGLPGQLILHVDPGLVERLSNLGTNMAKTMDQIIAQALGEFADTWEDHARTVATLNTEDDRTVLAVRPDKTVITDTPEE